MKRKHYPGFTVVELLIVLTIIAILAAITMFAFGSWRARTAQTEMKNELYSVSTSLKNYLNFNDTYPATLASINYAQNANVNLTYILRGGGASYCLSATSLAVPSTPALYLDSIKGPPPTTTVCS